MSIGKYTYGIPNIYIANNNENSKLVIGNYCSILENVNIYLGGTDRSNWISTYPFGHIYTKQFNCINLVDNPKIKGDVIIGNDVWIGENVKIISGITIGDGAVILNNSHIVKDVEPYSIVSGNPAVLVKYKFTQEQIENLLIIKWWEWDEKKINYYIPLLCSDDIDEFIYSVLNE
jgi:acetyltransferase-like isoleucine patch superfamily enzyme